MESKSDGAFGAAVNATMSSLPTTNGSATIPTAAVLPADFEEDGSLNLLIPLGALLGIMVLSALVFLMARRRLGHAYCRSVRRNHLGSYIDDDSDSVLEQQPNDVDDCDDPTECLLRGKLQIDNKQRYTSYQTTQVNNGTSELYT